MNRIRSSESTTFHRQCLLQLDAESSSEEDEDDNDDDDDDDKASLEANVFMDETTSMMMMNPNKNDKCVMDEYVEQFGTTVRQQLERRHRARQKRLVSLTT